MDKSKVTGEDHLLGMRIWCINIMFLVANASLVALNQLIPTNWSTTNCLFWWLFMRFWTGFKKTADTWSWLTSRSQSLTNLFSLLAGMKLKKGLRKRLSISRGISTTLTMKRRLKWSGCSRGCYYIMFSLTIKVRLVSKTILWSPLFFYCSAVSTSF